MTDSITYDDVVDIASMAALNDFRTVGEKEADLWHMIAVRERWTRATAMQVVLEYVSHGADRPRLTPAAISDALRKARRQAAQAFVPPRIPEGLPDSQYPRWYRRQLAEFVDGALEAWAAGAPLPIEASDDSQLALPVGEAPAQLRAEIERQMPRIGSGGRSQVSTPRRASPADLDPHRRAEARAQLDALRAEQARATPAPTTDTQETA